MQEFALPEGFAAPGAAMVRLFCDHQGTPKHGQESMLLVTLYRGVSDDSWRPLPEQTYLSGGFHGYGPHVQRLVNDRPLTEKETAQAVDVTRPHGGGDIPRLRFNWRCRCNERLTLRHEKLQRALGRLSAREGGFGLTLAELRRLI